MTTARLVVGDSLDVLREMASDSIDAVCTDPPAGISFMNQSFDSDRGGRDAWVAWLAAILAECRRVMKPGAHAVIWSLPRTSGWTHRAIEDAGLIVRDCCVHIFSQGFPKNLDVGKAIDKAADYRIKATVRRAAVAAVETAGLQLPANSRWDWTNGEHAPGDAWWATFRAWLPTLSDEDRQKVERTTVATVQKTAGWFTSLDSYDITVPATDLARQWEGWGTSLKPAVEFWFLARKPLSEPSVAANVAKWGTGALNIDAARVGASKDVSASPSGSRHLYNGGWRDQSGDKDVTDSSRWNPNIGRWPPNLALSHAPGCTRAGEKKVRSNDRPNVAGEPGHGAATFLQGSLPLKKSAVGHADADGFETVDAWRCVEGCAVAELDRQSGASVSRKGAPRAARSSGDGWGESLRFTGAEYDDAGGASRFFPIFPADDPEPVVPFNYCGKASRSERDAGLLDVEPKPVAATDYNESGKRSLWGDDRREDPKHGNKPWSPARNHHPTVKSISLMRWLVKLVCPPAGVVLDCFAGSGSTGCAAVIEGCSFVGIEQDPAYVEIARRRIVHWAGPLFADVVVEGEG